MEWYQILGLGVLGGLICGGVFWALGVWLDYRDAKRWRRELEDVSRATGPVAESLRKMAEGFGKTRFTKTEKENDGV